MSRAAARALAGWAAIVLCAAPAASGRAEEPSAAPPSAAAQAALRLLEDKDPYQRQLGFLRLEALREASTAPVIRGYLTSRDPETRAFSLRAVAAIEGKGAIPLLVQVLQADKHPRVRRGALLGLEPLQPRHPELVPLFMKALRDRSPEVRMTAVDIVSRIETPEAKDAIRKRVRREGDRDVRRVLDLAVKRSAVP